MPSGRVTVPGIEWIGAGPYSESSAPETSAFCFDVIIIMMRTTLNLPDDITDVIRSVAEAKGVSLGAAAADLIRRGLRSEARLAEEDGLPCFVLPANAAPITLEQTLAAEDE